ncbi:hypothetical protein WG66_004307 [Moniliophthora roreri]|nr:hypothetical protein WG66_004307 [Moniliophthora roreri]
MASQSGQTFLLGSPVLSVAKSRFAYSTMHMVKHHDVEEAISWPCRLPTDLKECLFKAHKHGFWEVDGEKIWVVVAFKRWTAW